MTERSAFDNPPIQGPSITSDQLQRILTLQGKILREAVIRNDHAMLLDEVCLLAESFTSNAVATIMLLDPAAGTLHVESAPSLSAEDIEAFNGLRSGDGSCGNAVYHNEVMYVCNTLEDARWARITDLATRFNICSCFSFPIVNPEGDAIGSFAISSFEPRTPDGFHRALLEVCTNICSVILQRRADEQLKAQVLEQQIRAERVESLGILAGGIAHDFNNLLTTIMGNVDLTASRLPVGPAKEGLDLAMKAIESASELTRQLMSVGKGINPVRVPQDIRSIVQDSAEFALHGSSVSYNLTGVDSLRDPIIHVDGGQIGQLIQNLVINARQAMPDGGVVQIACAEFDDPDHPALEPGDYLRIAVRDSGEGMSKEVLDHLFEPYFTTRDTGSGLGLFLCYSIVKSHGGQIEVDSELGKGTEIVVYLPRTLSAEAATAPPRPVERKPIVGANLLIMDDDQLVRQTLRRILEQLGHQVWESEHGEQAISLLKETQRQGVQLHACVLDLTVPGGMGGMETKDRIKEIDASVKLIVSSGYAIGDAGADCASAGFDGLITKPYSVAAVRQLLEELLL